MRIALNLLFFGLLMVVGAPAAMAGDFPPIGVPEPTCMALLAAAIGGVAWAKFRKR